jgi:hypothetical protein
MSTDILMRRTSSNDLTSSNIPITIRPAAALDEKGVFDITVHDD